MLLFLTIVLCLAPQIITETPEVDEDGYFLSQYPELDTFDLNLLKATTAKNKNVICSPFSLKLLLAILYEGSASATKREIENTLQFPKEELLRTKYKDILNTFNSTKDYKINIGTRLFLDSQRNVNQAYASIIKSSYYADVNSTNFEKSEKAAAQINTWVNEVSNGKIDALVESDDIKQSLMVLANVIYFKGQWRTKFPKNETFESKFYKSDKMHVTVPFMKNNDFFYFYESDVFDAKLLRLPYKGSRFSLLLALPNSHNGLNELINKLNPFVLGKTLYDLQKTNVLVTLPKFQFEFQQDYVKILQQFGLKQMFQNTASFPGIVRDVNSTLLRMLTVTDILQKSGIQVDEEGSEVYAATGINIGNKFGEPQATFNANRPFIFFLMEETKSTILYIGKVEDPTMKSSESKNDAKDEKVPEPVAEGVNNRQDVYPVYQDFSQQSLNPVYQPSADPSQYPVLQPSLQPSLSPSFAAPLPPALSRFNFFDVALLKELANLNENVFVSPLSIKATLAMILEGAHGICANEIRQALRVGGIEDIRRYLTETLNALKDSRYLVNHNALFVSNKAKVIDEYKNKVQNNYKGLIQEIDFSHPDKAVAFINKWVQDATHGQISEIVGPENISKDSSVVIANALNFKGIWGTAFDISLTKQQCFFTQKRCINVNMMQASSGFDGFKYAFLNDLDAEAIDIPYEGEYSMLVMMPTNRSNVYNLATDFNKLTDVLDKLKKTEITLEFPKFTIESSRDLIEFLKPLRIETIFSPDANLTGIVKSDNVRVNNIIHKTKIEVDELGTKASAATGAVVIPLMGSTDLKLTINRPFIYFIYHTPTKSIVFEGIFVEPVENLSGPQNQRIYQQNRRQQNQQQIKSRNNFY